MRKYLVTWHPKHNPANYRGFIVEIVDGYSTLEDAPKIIGATMNIDPNEITIVQTKEL